MASLGHFCCSCIHMHVSILCRVCLLHFHFITTMQTPAESVVSPPAAIISHAAHTDPIACCAFILSFTLSLLLCILS